MATSDSTTKSCSKCKQLKPATLEYFPAAKELKTGFHSWCHECHANAGREYYAKHRDKIREKQRIDYVTNPEKFLAPKRQKYKEDPVYREKAKKQLKDWNKNNPEKSALSVKKSRSKHKIKRAEYNRGWRAKNPERVREHTRRDALKRDPIARRANEAKRRAAKKQSNGSYTSNDVELQRLSQKGLCWHCGKPVGDEYHIDHLIPLSRGGSNNPRNIVISCPHCNLSKHDKFPHEWNGRLL